MPLLPQPSDQFRWVQVGSAPALVCCAIEPHADHLFTTRPWALGERRGDEQAAWGEVAAAIGVAPQRVVRLQQVHGADVILRRRDEQGIDGPGLAGIADIVMSDDSEAALAIQTADCVPLLIVDRRTGAMAAAHAGWRGLGARVPAVTIARLSLEFDSRPSDLLVAAGPSIGACCYEVGEEVRGRFLQAGFNADQIERWFFRSPQSDQRNPSLPGLSDPARPEHWYFDSALAARHQLESAGVPAGQIFTSGLCTASHPATLCSYRRDGSTAGRMAAVIKARGSGLRAQS